MSTFYVLAESSGSCFTVGQLVGSGTPRIFGGDVIYVYRMNSALWTTRDFGGNWINIIPAGLDYVSNVCQTSGSATSNVTYVTGSGTASIPARYQLFPEITAWSSGSPIPSGSLSDAVSSTFGDLPILIGNSAPANAARVWRSDFSAPYGVAKSDTGLPTTARVWDLDIAE